MYNFLSRMSNISSLFLIDFISDCHFFTQTNTAYDIYRYITLILTPLSIVSNCFAFIIFKQPVWKKSVMSKILQTLSVFEMLFNICVLLEASIRPKIDDQHSSLIGLIIFIYVMTAAKVLMIVFLIARNWTVVILAAHRYESVCRPVGSCRYIRSDNIKIIFSCIVILSIVIALPRMMETKIEICQPTLSITRFVPLFIASRWYLYLHTGLLLFFMQNGGPVILVCLLSSFVLRVIKKMKKLRKSHLNLNDKGGASQPSGDKLIVILCAAFFVLETPAFFSKILHHYFEFQGYTQLNMHIGLLANTLIYLDSIINIAVYVISNPTFRQTSKRLLSRLVCKENRSNGFERMSMITAMPTMNAVETLEM